MINAFIKRDQQHEFLVQFFLSFLSVFAVAMVLSKAVHLPPCGWEESKLHEGLCGMLMGMSKSRRAWGGLRAEGLLIRTALRHSPREFHFVICHVS